MENAVILIGPKKWGEDHAKFAQKNGSSALQYSAKVSDNVRNRLKNIVSKSPYAYIYIYVPKNYTCAGEIPPIKGSGKLEFWGEIIDIESSEDRIRSPWPTVNGPMYYDMYDKDKDFKYEFWFRVKRLSSCNLDISSVPIVLTDGTVKTYKAQEFTLSWRYKIAFAIKR